MIMAKEQAFLKAREQFEQLMDLVRSAARDGCRIDAVERDLMGLVPRPQWSIFSHRMIVHGRQVCHARKPNCGGCTLAAICPKAGVKAEPAGR